MSIDLNKKIKVELELSGEMLAFLPMAISSFVHSGAHLSDGLQITDTRVLNEMMGVAQALIDNYTSNIDKFKK
jgi:hypothetical protein